jgi:hypothetical protein
MEDKNRVVIIYSPTGKEYKYSTVDLGGVSTK